MQNDKIQGARRKRNLGRDTYELLGSMRFAVSLLTFIAIATIIGTVLQQNMTEIEYIDMFGTYWYSVFRKFDVAEIYNTWWFLLIMAFLVVSTSVCLIRNVPKMIKDMRTFREYVRQTSLRAFPHKIEIESDLSQEDGVNLGRSWLKHHGYQFKEKVDGDTVLLAAKKGSSNRLGFIFAHMAIVVICVGGLLDSELPNRLQIWTGYKNAIPDEARFISEVQSGSRYATNNPSFRGNMMISEGQATDYALLSIGGGFFMQELPFQVKLNKFIIEYYESNGMPKRFASDVDITDYKTGETKNHIIEVNHPHTINGVTLYQSSFDDGGSKLYLTAVPLKGSSQESFDVQGEVGAVNPVQIRFSSDGELYRVNFTEFSPINVEDLSKPGETKRTLQEQVVAVTGSAARKNNEKIHNVGPSFSYTLTNEANQSLEFKNYMLPIPLEEGLVYLFGISDNSGEGFRYIYLPADEKGALDEFLAMRSALNDQSIRTRIAREYAQLMQSSEVPAAAIITMADTALSVFAEGGFQGLDRYISGEGVPEAERIPEELRDPLQRLMRDYVVFSTMKIREYVRQDLAYPELNFEDFEAIEQNAEWLNLAIRALSDITHYPVPMTLHLRTFEHVQASVLQATRSPGKWTVYLGTFFLMIGVFMMLYVRDRRIWFWVNRLEDGGSEIKAAMTSHKRTLDFRKEFAKFKNDFSDVARS